MRSPAVPQDKDVEAVLSNWRHRAADTLMVATALLYLPAIVFLFAGQGAPLGLTLQATMVAIYLVVVLCAAFPGRAHGLRAWTFLMAGCAVALVGNLAFPEGPFMRALPVVLPMITLALFGRRAGRVATVAGMGAIFVVPLFHHTHEFAAGIQSSAPGSNAIPSGFFWAQSALLSALLVGPMILFERFHQFLADSLAGMAKEAEARREAYCNLEREVAVRKRLERDAARAADEERQRLGHEVHDGVCQQLTGALLRSEALERRLDRGEAVTVGEISALSSLLEEAIDEAHAVARGLCPLQSGAAELENALRALALRTSETCGIPCHFETAGDTGILDSAAAQHLYRIAQEALSNATRHAHATRIHVVLRETGDGLLLVVEDNGGGLPLVVSGRGMGLRTMAYRADLLEGELSIAPAGSGGTRVSCRIPRHAARPPDEHADRQEMIHES